MFCYLFYFHTNQEIKSNKNTILPNQENLVQKRFFLYYFCLL